jgi:hypothetical protein
VPLKNARYGADETRMEGLDARTVRMVALLGVLILVIFLGALAPHEAEFVFACAIDVGLLVVCWLKGKPGMVLAGLFVPLVGLIGAVRLAKPASYWAWHWYEPAKLVEAQRRFAASEGALADPS